MEDEGSMGSLEGSLLVAGGVALLAGVVAVALAVLSIGVLRRALRRITTRLEDVRRHPLLGLLPGEADPLLGALALEVNGLIADLRARLDESQRRSADLERLAAGPPDLALVGADSDWGITFFSRGAVALLGWPAEEIGGRHLEALFAPGEWERILPKLSRRSLRETGVSQTLKMQRRDATVFPALVSVAGLPGEAGGVLVAARDLTADQETDGRLRESEERYRRLVEGMGDGVFILQDERLVYANTALARMLGVERETLAGVPLSRLIHPHDVLRVLDLMRRAANDHDATGEVRCLLSSSGTSALEARLAWARTVSRGAPVLIGTVTDVSGRARLERALASSEARLQATLDSTGDGILTLEDSDRGLTVTLANRAFREMFGLPAEVLAGRTLSEVGRLLADQGIDAAVLEPFLSACAARREARLEGLSLSRPRRALIDLTGGLVVSTGGEPVGILVTARDVTRRAEGEQELHRSVDDLRRAKSDLETACRDLAAAQKEVAERNEQLVKLNTELRSLDEMKSNLLANVSHELHTPLVSIKGYTEMVLKRRLGPLTPEQERGLGVALKNIDRLIEMIDNLLSFSRIEKGETQLRLEDVPLWQIIDEAIELVGERIRKKGITVTTQYETDELGVRGDRLRIGQVLVNLLTNAVKFNRESGRITVTVRKGSKGFLEIEVADTGSGIPKEALGRIFERFYQVDASPRRKYEGTGIGLSIVRDILRLHGCTIRVASEVGQGSVFTFTLPQARDQEVPTSRPPTGRGRSQS